MLCTSPDLLLAAHGIRPLPPLGCGSRPAAGRADGWSAARRHRPAWRDAVPSYLLDDLGLAHATPPGRIPGARRARTGIVAAFALLLTAATAHAGEAGSGDLGVTREPAQTESVLASRHNSSIRSTSEG